MFGTFRSKSKTRFKYGGQEFGFLVSGQGLVLVKMSLGIVSITVEGQHGSIFLTAEDVKNLRDILNSEDFDVEES